MVPSATFTTIWPPIDAPRPEARCWTAELALMNPPRSRRSTLPVIIVRAATIRPALLSMNVPTDTDRHRQRDARQVGHHEHQADRNRRHHAVDRQLAVVVGQPANQGSADQRQNSARDEHPGQAHRLVHADIRHEVTD